MPGISIIIITYNRPDDTIALLKDLHGMHRQDLLEEVIVLNNASTTSYDEVTEFLGMHPDWPCRFVAAPENLGVSRGRNYAA
ncbi:MAG TPA: glycosyltransferase, partial [Flavihumibacter sp.]|nr:glycosyltransferase [Flavihumibacter sp.]